MNKAINLAKNIRAGSGNHGLSENQLINLFENMPESLLESFAYTLRKCAEHGKEFFDTNSIQVDKPNLSKFSIWHHIDEQWSPSWGFDKTQPGCYIYGIFENGAPTGYANFLDNGVIYIGESRAVTRNCMLGRRTDFKGTVRNERLSPYGCGTAFKSAFGKDKIDFCYQAYLPMHPSLCKLIELELLSSYFTKYNKIPVCNPSLDEVRLKKYISSL